MKEIIKKFCFISLHVPYCIHILLYTMSKSKKLIDEDLFVISEKWGIPYKGTMAFVYILFHDKYYRSIFYDRIGFMSCICSWYLPKAKDFYPCRNIGGGVYPAHPYATILNAKSIGRNFSFRQCTTLGNKRDGDGTTNGPTIGDNVTLGANVCVIGDITIGNNVIVGAGSVVVKDIPDNVVVAGNPARIIKNICK